MYSPIVPRVGSRERVTEAFSSIPSGTAISTKSLLSRFPVYDIPDGTKVLGFSVLILGVVRVLPGIDTQQRLVLPNDGILILFTQCNVSKLSGRESWINCRKH